MGALNLKDKYVVITGGESGIGVEVVRGLVENRAKIFVGGVDRKAAEENLQEFGDQVLFHFCDLGDLASVNSFYSFLCSELGEGFVLSLLLNNAAIADPVFREAEYTKRDGETVAVEKNFAVNYLGHFHLTNLLLPHLIAAGKETSDYSARVVNVSSGCHFSYATKITDVVVPPTKADGAGMKLQSNTKLLNIVHAKTLARKLESEPVHVCSVNPGIANTGIVRESSWGKVLMFLWSPFSQKTSAAAAKVLRCCLEEIVNGAYYEKDLTTARKDTDDKKEQDRIWGETEKLINKIKTFI